MREHRVPLRASGCNGLSVGSELLIKLRERARLISKFL